MLFRELDLTIPESADVIGVIGSYDGNYNVSNKSGKSTLMVDIPLYVLFGQGRTSDTALIHPDATSMTAGLTLDINGHTYQFERGKTAANKLSLSVNGREYKSDDYKELIDELFDLDKNSFLLTTCFRQGSMDQFMSMTPGERLKILSDWYGLGHWKESAGGELGEDIRFFAKQEDDLRSKIATLKENIDLKRDFEGELEEHTVALNGCQEDLTYFKEAQKAAEEKFYLEKELNNWQDKVSFLKGTIASNKENFKKASATVKDLEKRLEKAAKRLEDVDVKRMEEISDRLKEITRILISKRQHTGECPILLEPCDRIQTDTTGLEKEQDTLEEELKQLEIAFTGGTVVKDELVEELYKAQGLLDGIPSMNHLKAEQIRMEGELSNVEHKYYALMDKWDFETPELKDVDQTIKELEKERDDLQRAIGQIEADQESQSRTKEQVKKAEEELAGIVEELKILRFVQYSFSKAIPNALLETMTHGVEEEANSYLSKLSDDLSVTYSFLKELKKKEEACPICTVSYSGKTKCGICGRERQHKIKEELSVQVIENSMELDYELMSGGAQTMISFALRMATAKMLKATRQGRSSYDVALFDETFSFIDTDKKQKLMEFIINELPLLGFTQAFMISHDQDIKEYTPYVIRVDRRGDSSTAELL